MTTTPCISNWHCAGGGQDRRTDGLLRGQCRAGNRGRLRTGRAFRLRGPAGVSAGGLALT
ncbi:hypothetical protein NCGM1179_0513 [Pseudomonas aeruginosa NCMG1179]|nr:hypothetical protein NCGM1179_0513 [Pseudomonas aeruginosa NCMG1179]